MGGSLSLLVKLLDDKTSEVESIQNEIAYYKNCIQTSRNSLYAEILDLERQIKEIDSWYSGDNPSENLEEDYSDEPSEEHREELEKHSEDQYSELVSLEKARLQRVFLYKRNCSLKDVIRESLRFLYIHNGTRQDLKLVVGRHNYNNLPTISDIFKNYTLESLGFNEDEIFKIKRSMIVRACIMETTGRDNIRVDDVHDENVIEIMSNEGLSIERKRGELWLLGYSIEMIAEYIEKKLNVRRSSSRFQVQFSNGDRLSEYPRMSSNIFRSVRAEIARGRRFSANELVKNYYMSKYDSIHYENMGKLVDKMLDRIMKDNIPMYEYAKMISSDGAKDRRNNPKSDVDTEVQKMLREHYIGHSIKFDFVSGRAEKTKVWKRVKRLLESENTLDKLVDLEFSSDEANEIIRQRKREKAFVIPAPIAEEGILKIVGGHGLVDKEMACLKAYVNGYSTTNIADYFGFKNRSNVNWCINRYADRDFKVTPTLRRSLEKYIVYSGDTSAKAIIHKFGISTVVALHYSNLANIITKRIEEE